MRKLFIPLAGLLVAFVSTMVTAEEIESGLQKGDSVGAFNVKDVTGPKKGTSLCYRCAFGNSAVINIQARAMTQELTSLVKELDGLVDGADKKGKHAFVVLLTDDGDAAEEQLAAVAKKNEIKNIPLTLFDGIAGPPDYKISEDAEITIMMWTGGEVTKNHSFGKGGLTAEEVKKVLKDAEAHLK